MTASAVALVGLKDRYVPVSLGLLAWAVLRLARGRRALALGVLAAVTVAGAVVLVWNPLPRVFQNVRGAALLWSVLRAWNEWMPQAGLGSSPTRSSAFSTMGHTVRSPRPVSSSCGAGAARP